MSSVHPVVATNHSFHRSGRHPAAVVIVAVLLGTFATPAIAQDRPIETRYTEHIDLVEISQRLRSPERVARRVPTIPGWYEFVDGCTPHTPMWVEEEDRTVHSGLTGIPALDNELGHWSAVVLPIGHTPFDLDRISYVLWDGHYQFSPGSPLLYPSSADITHRVRIFTDTLQGAPPATPEVIVEFEVTPLESFSGWNLIELQLDEPLRVHDGERLWVSIEMTGTVEDRLSIGACYGSDNQTWAWSNATTTPYSWSLFNYQTDLMIWGFGDEIYE